jgi:hypothetical protein
MEHSTAFFRLTLWMERKEVEKMNELIGVPNASVASTNYAAALMGSSRKERHLRHEQIETRPKIDDAVCHYLEGEALKDALIFIDNIRASKMKIKWATVNVWSVHYRHKHVCDIRLENGSWSVSYDCVNKNSREDYAPYNVEGVMWLVGALNNAVAGRQKAYQAS